MARTIVYLHTSKGLVPVSESAYANSKERFEKAGARLATKEEVIAHTGIQIEASEEE